MCTAVLFSTTSDGLSVGKVLPLQARRAYSDAATVDILGPPHVPCRYWEAFISPIFQAFTIPAAVQTAHFYTNPVCLSPAARSVCLFVSHAENTVGVGRIGSFHGTCRHMDARSSAMNRPVDGKFSVCLCFFSGWTIVFFLMV